MERGQTPKILCLAPNSLFVSFSLLFPLFLFPSLFAFPFFSLKAFVRLNHAPTTYTSSNMYVHYTWGLLVQKLIIIIFQALSSPHMCLFLVCTFSSPLYASIWLKFWPSWVAWLLCLCPTFPLVRLGHKGSTSAIVTVGSSRCVPQTGWCRKLVFLREYSIGGLKMFFTRYTMNPQMLRLLRFFNHSLDMLVNACWPRERNP